MALKITKESHLDHNLSLGQVEFIKKHFEEEEGFFIKTVELPEELGTVECSLIGPLLGQDAIHEDNVEYKIRGTRKWTSRMFKGGTRDGFVKKPHTRLVTVIAGPAGDDPMVLYTAFGGPQAPREPGDPDIKGWNELLKSREFWKQHALLE